MQIRFMNTSRTPINHQFTDKYPNYDKINIFNFLPFLKKCQIKQWDFYPKFVRLRDYAQAKQHGKFYQKTQITNSQARGHSNNKKSIILQIKRRIYYYNNETMSFSSETWDTAKTLLKQSGDIEENPQNQVKTSKKLKTGGQLP